MYASRGINSVSVVLKCHWERQLGYMSRKAVEGWQVMEGMRNVSRAILWNASAGLGYSTPSMH